jgi:hypothetical protein
VKEEDRLSYVISEIELDARIVPRGAFLRTPNGEVHVNREFEGRNVFLCCKPFVLRFIILLCISNILDFNQHCRQ